MFAAGACTGVATSIGGKPGPEAGLLRGKSPSRSAHVTHVDRLTDGIAAAPDDPPRTELTSLFGSPDAFVDLRPGRGDAHRLRGDRRRRRRHLRARAVRRRRRRSRRCGRAARRTIRGMQPRARARSARHAGATCGWPPPAATASMRSPSCRPPPTARRAGRPCWRPCTARRSNGRRRRRRGRSPRSAAAYVLAYRRRAPDFFKLLVAAPLGVALALAFQLAEIWPPPRSLLGPLLAAPAIVAAAFALRKVVSRKASVPDQPIRDPALDPARKRRDTGVAVRTSGQNARPRDCNGLPAWRKNCFGDGAGRSPMARRSLDLMAAVAFLVPLAVGCGGAGFSGAGDSRTNDGRRRKRKQRVRVRGNGRSDLDPAPGRHGHGRLGHRQRAGAARGRRGGAAQAVGGAPRPTPAINTSPWGPIPSS